MISASVLEIFCSQRNTFIDTYIHTITWVKTSSPRVGDKYDPSLILKINDSGINWFKVLYPQSPTLANETSRDLLFERSVLSDKNHHNANTICRGVVVRSRNFYRPGRGSIPRRDDIFFNFLKNMF